MAELLIYLMRRLFLLAFAVLSSSYMVPEVSARPPEVLSYGTVAGMEVTVVARSGLDTSKAVIGLKLTRHNAVEFCERGLGLKSTQCVEEVLHTHGAQLTAQVYANCQQQTWTDMFGQSFELLGMNEDAAVPTLSREDYLIIDKQSLPVRYLDGSEQSGYRVEIALLRALCPATFERTERRTQSSGNKLAQSDTSSSGRIVEVNRAAKEDSMSGQTSAPIPRPRPKPIEVLMMAAVEMRIAPPSVSPSPDPKVKSSPVAGGSQGYVISPESLAEAPDVKSNDSDKTRLAAETENGEVTTVPTIRTITAADSGDDLFWWPSQFVFDTNKAMRRDGAPPQYAPRGSAAIAGMLPSVSDGAREVPTHSNSPSASLLVPSAQSASAPDDGGLKRADERSLEKRIAALETKVGNTTLASSSDRVLCKTALSSSGLQWESEPEFKGVIDAALKRNLSIEKCRVVLGLANPPSSTQRD